MKTYAESKQKPPFDWNDFLRRAKNKKITKGERIEAQELANSWVTCACGNLCDALPREENGKPVDDTLYDLGVDFSLCIDVGYFDKAEKILNKIEKRSARLLKK